MSTQNIKFDDSKLTGELFYSAFLSLSETEKESFLRRLFSSMNQKAVALTIQGKPLTQRQYIQHIEDISSDLKNGNFISHEDMIRELKEEFNTNKNPIA